METDMENAFSSYWKKDVYARCACGTMLHMDADVTQMNQCEVCHKAFDDAQAQWEAEFMVQKTRIAALGSTSIPVIATSAKPSNKPSTSSGFGEAPLFIPSHVNGVQTNVSCKDVFEKDIFISYMKNPKIFDDEVGLIGSFGNNDFGCYDKYVAVYEILASRSEKMAMNKKIRDCAQDPELTVKALINLLTSV